MFIKRIRNTRVRESLVIVKIDYNRLHLVIWKNLKALRTISFVEISSKMFFPNS